MNRRPARPCGLGGVEQRQGLLEVAGHRPRHDGGVALGDEQAEHAAGAQHLGDRGQRGGRVVDDLEHAVAQHHVGAVGTGDVEQGGQVALLAGDPVGDAALAGPAVQRRQGVRAGVDHPDPVAELGDPDGEPAGAAADVEDVAAPVPSRTGRRASQTTAVRAALRRSLAALRAS